MTTGSDLRENIYSQYGKDFQDSGENFDRVAADRWGKAYDWYFRNWLPADKSASIGELAPGTGKMLHFLKSRGYNNLSAVDISPDQVRMARQVAEDVTLGNALEWLAERKGHFDLIIALDLIEHFTRSEALQFLELCYAALKQGGRLILQTPNADSPFGMQHRFNDMTHEWCFNNNLLKRLFFRTGFSDIEGRELGPPAWGYSFKATIRWFIWQTARSFMQLINIAEEGVTQPVLTRIFLMSAVRR
jgi:SAM-dependent methyltransferase